MNYKCCITEFKTRYKLRISSLVIHSLKINQRYTDLLRDQFTALYLIYPHPFTCHVLAVDKL